MSLTQSQIEKKLTKEALDELLPLWWAEQGAEKRRDLALMAAAIPFPHGAALRVLDLCCGPGDLGRAIRARYPNSQIDCLDRDVFLISMCIGMNRRKGVPGRHFVRDLWDTNWHDGLEPEYDVIATANALHWLDAGRVAQVSQDVFRLLRPAGVFLFAEPACAEKTFAAGFAEWKSRQPSRYTRENWERFWSRANEILGYDRRHAGIRLGSDSKRRRLPIDRCAFPGCRRSDSCCCQAWKRPWTTRVTQTRFSALARIVKDFSGRHAMNRLPNGSFTGAFPRRRRKLVRPRNWFAEGFGHDSF